MKIEIAEPGRMTQSGSSMLKLIQNNKTPVLDLFVRESIQNSLDAHKEGARAVTVEYLTGGFSSHELGNELEGITTALEERFLNDECQYLAICDSDTVGLTGEMDVQKVKGSQYGNLLKLVYEICKPQEAEGAGGSWGLGKTVYFRIGIGLVIYYSRISEGNGKYSSRLAASLVEDETKSDAIIPEYKELAKRGIAWWGNRIRENTTVPVTDEEYIDQFLDIFGIKPYSDEKTGTVVIIPYINRETLLANNRIDYADDINDQFSPYWYSSIESYLRIAVQRWYAPRLGNADYPYGAFLRVLINGEGISVDSMEPAFKVVQELYNRANHVELKFGDFFLEHKVEPIVGDAIVKKYLKDTIAGNIACVKLARDALGMGVPHNKPEPAVYFNCEITDKSANRPLIFYVRKPGMIVSYENVSTWTAGIPMTGKNEFVFGIFVLNSPNGFKIDGSPVRNLEEYVRKSEMADHTSWNDWTEGHFNPRIISKIQKSVTKLIGNQYAGDDVEHQPKENSELSRYLGDMILPPDGFGRGANVDSEKSKSNRARGRQKRSSFSVLASHIKYCADTMIVPLELRTTANERIMHTAFEVQIDSESGKIGLNGWQNELGLTVPFSIAEIDIIVNAIDGEKIEATKAEMKVDRDNPVVLFRGIAFSLRTTKQGTAYGLDVTAQEEHSIQVQFKATIRLNQKNVRTAFLFEREEK